MSKTLKVFLFLVCICLCITVTSQQDNVLDTSIQLLGGMSETAALKTIDYMCNANLPTSPPVSKSIGNELYLLLRVPCLDVGVRLQKSKKLLKNPNFDLEKKVVVFITGWMSDVSYPAIDEMAEAFHCRGGYNFLAVDTSHYIENFNDWTSLNVNDIGVALAKSLSNLVPSVSAKNIYLIGHSLGAHIAGKAGKHFKKLTGKKLSRITGLDPASVCFGNQNKILSEIHSGDATFVDIIHTNPGGAGKKESVGDVDFFPIGLNPIMPGCDKFGCSHGRAIAYYKETVYPENENNFLGQKCNSKGVQCGAPHYTMGFATPKSLEGDYYMDYNSESPYGKNAKSNAVTRVKKCNKCKNKK